jgi:glycosidase
MNFTSTHDISRAINIFGSNEFQEYSEWAWNTHTEDRNYQKNYQLSQEQYNYGKQVYKAYIFLLTFFPGILSIFYGDEVGLQGLGNLSNRKTFPWNNIDHDLLHFFQKMGTIRREEPFLEEADLNIYDINNNYIMFERKQEEESALITVNRTNNELEIPIPEIYMNPDKIYSIHSDKILTPYGGIALKKTKK